MHTVIQLSKRDIINGNEIDYLNYNYFNYDFDLIENELGKIILNGKCLFEEDKLNFVTFKYENNSKIFSDFYKKYPQKELSQEEKNALDNYYNEKKKESNYKQVFKDFFDSLLFLFFYLNDNLFDEEEQFKNVLNKINNNNIKISPNDIKDYFNEVELKVNTFTSMFFYLENKYLIGDNFKELIKPIEGNFKDLIKDKEKLNNIIQKYNYKEDLINAIKRYAFRYIIDNKNIEKEQIKNQNLILELGKPDLWELNKIKIDEIKNSLNDNFGDFNLKVGQILTFYYELIKIS